MADTNYISRKQNDIKEIKNYEAALNILHMDAVVQGAKKHLGYDGKQDFSEFAKKLDEKVWYDKKLHADMAGTMSNVYAKAASIKATNGKTVEELGKSEDAEDKRIYNLMTQYHGGLVKEQLQATIGAQKENFLPMYASQIAPSLVKQVTKNIKDGILADIQEEHIEDIIKYALDPSDYKLMENKKSVDNARALLEAVADKEPGEKLNSADFKKLSFIDFENYKGGKVVPLNKGGSKKKAE